MTNNNENRKKQIEEMTSIWASGDEYSRGFLNGIIEATIHLASRQEERPVA